MNDSSFSIQSETFFVNGIKSVIKSEIDSLIFNLFKSREYTVIPIIANNLDSSRFIWITDDKIELLEFNIMMDMLIKSIETKIRILEIVKNNRSLTLTLFNQRINLLISLSFIIIEQNTQYVEHMKKRINLYLER